MSRRARITLFVVLAVALFALIVGGFFWPRPQMQRGPWAPPDSTPGSAAPGSAAPDSTAPGSTAPDSTAPADTGYLRPR